MVVLTIHFLSFAQKSLELVGCALVDGWLDRQIEDTRQFVVVSLLIGPRSTDSIKLRDNKVFPYHHELIINRRLLLLFFE